MPLNAPIRPLIGILLGAFSIAILPLISGCYEGAGNLPDDDDTSGDTTDDDDSGTDDDDSGADDDDSLPPDSDGDGWVDSQDCAPDDPTIHPEAAEVCNGLDDDCDGELSASAPDERDLDGDAVPACAGDCEDNDPTIHPGAEDVCDGVDSNCDGYPEDTPSGDPQEMFISGWGHLYITIMSVDAGCDIYLAMDAPVPIADMVGEVHAAVGTEVDVGSVLPCTEMLYTASSCGTPFSSLDPQRFHVLPIGDNHWILELEDADDNDFNDLIFEASVEPRDNSPR